MQKKLLTLLSLFLLLFSIVGCSHTPTNSLSNQYKEDTTYPITIIDQAGREVLIEAEPNRLVSGYYISTSLLMALDLEDKLVGIEAKGAKRPLYLKSAPDLTKLPNVGTAKEFDLEGCIALNPDLVILPLKLKNTASSLEQLDVDVLYVNPENQTLLNEMITLISSATNTQGQAQKLIDFINKQEKYLNTQLKDARRPSVYLAGNANLLSTAGSEMYQSSMIALAGGLNVADSIKDSYWAEIDYEQLLTWNPEYIILASDATYSVDDVLNDPNLKDCSAIQNKKVFQLPNDAEAWDSPVPSGILGSIWLSSILHEDLFSADDTNKIINEYYETFYHFTYN